MAVARIRDLCGRPWDRTWPDYPLEIVRRRTDTMGDLDKDHLRPDPRSAALPDRLHLADHR